MSVFELSRRDENLGVVDLGMAVIGSTGLDTKFRKESDDSGHADELLKDATLEDLLDPVAIRVAAAGASGYVAVGTSVEVIDAA